MKDLSLNSAMVRMKLGSKTVQPLRIAVTYYLPEGRYLEAPLKLKKKKNKQWFYALVLALGLSLTTLSAGYNRQDPIDYMNNSTILDRSVSLSKQRSGSNSGLTADASVNLAENYKSLPITAEKTDNKLGIDDPNPDEKRVNRLAREDGFMKIQQHKKITPKERSPRHN